MSTTLMESLFQHSLDDLIKSLRLPIPNESTTTISNSLTDIRKELKSTDPHTKSTALEKLTYLHSLHSIDMSFAAFNVVEVMSSPKYSHKRIGYLAAAHSFNDSTEVILLTTNLLRKDLKSCNEYEVCLALECLSIIGTHDLVRDLCSEVFTLLGSSKGYVRKKAVGAVLRLFGKYPDAVRVVFKRLVENLESENQQVLSAVVGVFCELSLKDGNSYLPLAPEFYRILVDSKNNWVLIKVLKIFSSLGVLEPRLARRIVEPICEHMRTTTAKSLLVECVRTVVSCLSGYESAVKIAAEKVRELVNDEDPNLKYLGLKALLSLGEKHLWAVLENKEVVIKSLSDEDPNIRHAALHLVMEMASEDNVIEMSRVLLSYALKSDPEFCNEILGSILSTCGKNDYEVVIDFDWYVSLLGEMSRNPHCQKGLEIEHQLVDIGQRVKEVRPHLVHVARDLLIDPALLGNEFLHRILCATAWVSGEYVEFSKNPFELIEALLQPRTNLLPPMVRAVYIQSAFKVVVFCLHLFFVRKQVTCSSRLDVLARGINGLHSEREFPEGPMLAKREDSCASFECEQDEEFKPMVQNTTSGEIDIANGGDDIVTHGQEAFSASVEGPFTHESILAMINLVKAAVGPLLGCDEVEVQERARNVLGLVELLQRESSDQFIGKEGSFKGEELRVFKMIEIIHSAFSEEIGPVSVISQERVTIPEGLVLNDDLADLESVCGDILSPLPSSFSMGNRLFGENYGNSSIIVQKEESELSTESTSLLAQHRRRHGLYYLPAQKDESTSNDYPPPNDLQPTVYNANDSAQDLLKITEQSLSSRKKPNHSKPRPVVVKLDEDEREEKLVSSVKPFNNLEQDQLAGAVRNILRGEDKPVSSQNKSSHKSSGKRRVKGVSLNNEHAYQPEEKLDDIQSGVGTSSSRRTKHGKHGKERENSPKNIDENKEESSQKDKKKSHRHSRNKTRHRADLPLNVVAQTPVIPDFLL